MDFKTNWKKQESTKEILSEKDNVNRLGYVPMDIQINQYLVAGERLKEMREEMYHFSSREEIDEDYYDRLRQPNLDRVDVDRIIRENRDKARQMAQEADLKASKDENDNLVSEEVVKPQE